jgi:hypothetical protein
MERTKFGNASDQSGLILKLISGLGGKVLHQDKHEISADFPTFAKAYEAKSKGLDNPIAAGAGMVGGNKVVFYLNIGNTFFNGRARARAEAVLNSKMKALNIQNATKTDKAYDEGRRAKGNGKQITDNPYPDDTNESVAWDNGWHRAVTSN